MNESRKDHTMRYILITGGVASGIGKGTLAATLGRQIARSGYSVTYQKLEPCLQTSIGSLSNRVVGEIVVDRSGNVYDSDVARAAFYIPGFEPRCLADLSLGIVLSSQLCSTRAQQLATARLDEVDACYQQTLGSASGHDFCIVEVGGTAGEAEHEIVVEAFRRSFERPFLHMHLTTTVDVGGRQSTKPAQHSLRALEPKPHVIVFRDPGISMDEVRERLRPVVGASLPILAVGADERWPERAYHRMLVDELAELSRWQDILSASRDPLFAEETADPPEPRVYIQHDGAGPEGYGSLVRRLRCWTRGQVRFHWDEQPLSAHHAESFDGLVRIGEAGLADADEACELPTLDIYSAMRDSKRQWSLRADWWGLADEPSAKFSEFIDEVVQRAKTTPSVTDDERDVRPGENAYQSEAFAEIYVAESRDGELRDHSVLDILTNRCLPTEGRLPEMRVLDVGCGDGRWSQRLVERGVGHVVGVEPAAPMAQRARERNLPRFELIEAPIEEARFEQARFPGLFDFVLASMSLDHVETIGPVLDRLAAQMKPGARLVLTTEHPLRTAPTDNVRWIDEEDGHRASRVRDYGKRGWREFHWFDRPEPVRVYHRPAGEWLAAASQAGLDLVRMHEPVADAPRDGNNPRFWMLVFERPVQPRRIVTIDGAAATGKTTLGRALAEQLGWRFVDTGPMSAEQLDDVLQETDGGLVVAGRSLGRHIPRPLTRFWLEAPLEVRAERRGVRPDELDARDQTDRQRGRLITPDIAARCLDTSQLTVAEMSDEAERLVRAQLRRAV